MRVAIISLHSLQTLALKGLLRRYPGLTVESFPDVDMMQTSSSEFDIFMLNAETFLQYPHYFLPRKTHCLVVFDGKSYLQEYSHTLPEGTDSYQTVYSDSDEADIESAVNLLLNICKNEDTPSAELSQREKEVLRELASGLTNKEIADRLCISANTVITHRKNISVKLGIKSASGLSLYALMNGII